MELRDGIIVSGVFRQTNMSIYVISFNNEKFLMYDSGLIVDKLSVSDYGTYEVNLSENDIKKLSNIKLKLSDEYSNTLEANHPLRQNLDS